MLRQLKMNQSGMVLVTVLMVAVVMIVLSVGILNRSMTQSLSSEDAVRRIQAEQLAKGAAWLSYQRIHDGIALSDVTVTLDNRTYTADVNLSLGAGADGWDLLDVQVSY